MSTRVVFFLFALLACAATGAATAVAQTSQPPSGATAPSATARTPIEFYLAHGEADACGRGCNEWIAAEGRIDIGAVGRFRQLIKKLKDRRPPIYFHSLGGKINDALELGRLIRERKFEVSIGHTVPLGCSSDTQSDNSCEAQKRSGTAIEAEISQTVAMCNSACVYALAGGAVRLVPPSVKLGIHDIGIDTDANVPRGIPVATLLRPYHARLRSYLREMGIDDALYAAVLATPNESLSYLQREQLVSFGIDRREFGETVWRFVDKPALKIRKLFFVRADGDQPRYVDGVIEIGCNAVFGGLYLMFERQELGPDADGSVAGSPTVSVAIKGEQISLARTASAKFYVRMGQMAQNTLDTVGDDVAIALPGTEFARKERGNVPLDMYGFPAAYAKLRPLCVRALSHSQAALPQSQAKGPVNDPQAATAQSQQSQKGGTLAEVK
jgi:hypothetical protein